MCTSKLPQSFHSSSWKTQRCHQIAKYSERRTKIKSPKLDKVQPERAAGEKIPCTAGWVSPAYSGRMRGRRRTTLRHMKRRLPASCGPSCTPWLAAHLQCPCSPLIVPQSSTSLSQPRYTHGRLMLLWSQRLRLRKRKESALMQPELRAYDG